MHNHSRHGPQHKVLNVQLHELILCSCMQVLSPLPQFVNPGNTAWASGGGSPLFFVMKCQPQHYYLLHEIGHRFGMPHATIYKLSNQTATPKVSVEPEMQQACRAVLEATG
jgi:hypothetical protein